MYICVGFWFGVADIWSVDCKLLVAPVKKLAVNAGATAIWALVCVLGEVAAGGPVMMVMVVVAAPGVFAAAGVFLDGGL
jgi:hypothetical protein